MLDPKLLRQSATDVAANLARRGFEFDADAYLALEERRKALQVETETLQNERNTSAKRIGKAKAQGEDIEPLLAAVKDLGERLEQSQKDLQEVQAELRDIELGLPNLLSDDVPVGDTEDDNTEVRRWGEPTELALFEAAQAAGGSAAGSRVGSPAARARWRRPRCRRSASPTRSSPPRTCAASTVTIPTACSSLRGAMRSACAATTRRLIHAFRP